MLLADLSIDTAWCPVCDRAISPQFINIPIIPDIPKAQRKLQQFNPPGLVNGTGRALRRPHNNHLKSRSVISPELPYYCSDECRLIDLQHELDLTQHLESLSLFSSRSNLDSHDDDDDDDDNRRSQCRVPPPPPSNTPSDSYFHSPSSPHFHSSGTDSDASSLDDPASYSPTKILKSLPPLKPLSREPSENLLPELPEEPICEEGGIMLAAQRIQAAFNSVAPPKPGSPRNRPVVIKGWTDGDRTQWRSSVYGGAVINLEPYFRKSEVLNNSTSGSYTAQGSRRAMGLHDVSPTRRSITGQSAPQPHALPESKLAFRRNTSSSYLSSDDASSPTEETVHPLLATPLQGKLLVPQIRSSAPTRSNSSQSLSSLRKESVLAKSPLGQNVVLANVPSVSGKKESSSWSSGGEFMYKLPPRHPKKEKRIKRVWVPSPENVSGVVGSGEGKWERKEVEVEVQPERKRLFLFGD